MGTSHECLVSQHLQVMFAKHGRAHKCAKCKLNAVLAARSPSVWLTSYANHSHSPDRTRVTMAALARLLPLAAKDEDDRDDIGELDKLPDSLMEQIDAAAAAGPCMSPASLE